NDKNDKPPLYVIDKDIKNNILIVGTDEETFASGMVLNNSRILEFENSRIITCQIRYRQTPFKIKFIENRESRIKILFSEPIRAVTPGQHAVFYNGDRVMGGGIIENQI
ncbi:MAG: tRNA-specific 2-thiouridylase, partial [Candidatus Berkelbacteria bacterium Licking1014_85]